eukprot:TRINITY_DN11674_c0_g4_i2.p1 TRINITY_DN11674_c0_g4~~TRINITY_DN11674_c0_g4_i2.p1  ORF type:complete len:238 (+),score=29.82 TRINITY_DN11674_c0_g4_i2:72-785(+)
MCIRDRVKSGLFSPFENIKSEESNACSMILSSQRVFPIPTQLLQLNAKTRFLPKGFPLKEAKTTQLIKNKIKEPHIYSRSYDTNPNSLKRCTRLHKSFASHKLSNTAHLVLKARNISACDIIPNGMQKIRLENLDYLQQRDANKRAALASDKRISFLRNSLNAGLAKFKAHMHYMTKIRLLSKKLNSCSASDSKAKRKVEILLPKSNKRILLHCKMNKYLNRILGKLNKAKFKSNIL